MNQHRVLQNSSLFLFSGIFNCISFFSAVDCPSIVWTDNGHCGSKYDDKVCNNQTDNNGVNWLYCSDDKDGLCGETDFGFAKYNYPAECADYFTRM